MLFETWFHVRHLLANVYFVQTALAAPSVFVALRAQAGTADDELWAMGSTVGLWTVTVTAVGIFGYQRSLGTLEHIVLSPRPLGTALLPVAVSCTATGIASVPVAGVIAALCGHPPALRHPVLVVIGLVLASVSCAATALVLAGLFVITRNAIVYEPVLVAPVLLLCGAVIPRSELSPYLRAASLLHPLTGSVAIIEAGSATIPPGRLTVVMWTGQAIVGSLALVVLSAFLLRVAASRALRDGSLSLS